MGEGYAREAYYNCIDGYYLAGGSPSRKCSAGGTWSGKPIVCRRNHMLSYACKKSILNLKVDLQEQTKWSEADLSLDVIFTA